MNNEEKILSMLETLTEDVREIKQDVKELKQRVGSLEQRVGSLEARQAKLEKRFDNLEEDVQYLRTAVAVIEIEHGRKLDALKEGLDTLREKVEDHINLSERVVSL